MRFILMVGAFTLVSFVVQAETMSASSLLCTELSQSSKVAGAAYVPGVDVKGRRVTSADVGSDNQVMAMDVVRIPIDVDLAQRFGLALPAGVELKPTLGVMSISQDGTVTFDGQNLTQQAGAYCSDAQNTKAQGKSLNGQAGADRIISNSDTDVDLNAVIEGQAY